MQTALIDGSKFCGGCSSEQPLSNWTAKGTTCKTCSAKAARKAYEKIKANPELLSARYAVDAKRRQETKRKAVDYKGNKCYDCGNTFADCVYDFHHLDPSQKDFTIAKKSYANFESIKAELDKCVLLCANCHRIRHYEDSISGR